MEKFLELDPQQLNQLRDEFFEYDGLTVQQFVAAMLRLQPPSSKEEELHLVHQLADLFAQVDINGDGTMEFDEFTLFFISAGMTKNEFKPRLSYSFKQHERFEFNTKHSRTISKVKYIPELQKLVALDSRVGEILVYNPAVPNLNHGMQLISSINVNDRENDERGAFATDFVFIPEFCVLAVTVTSFKLNIYDAAPLVPSKKYYDKLYHIKISQEAERRGRASGAAIEVKDRNGVVRMDAPPALQDVFDSLKCDLSLILSQHCSTPQQVVAWHHHQRELLTAAGESCVYRWTLHVESHGWQGKTAELAPCGVLEGHTDCVSCILYVPLTNPLRAYANLLTAKGENPVLKSMLPGASKGGVGNALSDVVVTAGVDHRFCVYRWGDRGVNRLCNKVEHSKAVSMLAFLPQSSLIMSAGLDHFVQAWDLNLDDGSPVFRLDNHEGGVSAMEVLPGREQLVTMDSTGTFRWWNVTNGFGQNSSDRLMQQFTIESSSIVPYAARGLTCLPKLPDMEMWARGHPMGANGERLGRHYEVIDLAATGDDELTQLDAFAVQRAAKAVAEAAGAAAVSGSKIDTTAKEERQLRSINDMQDAVEVGCGAVICCGPRFKCLELMRTTDSRSDPSSVTFSLVTCEIYCIVDSDLKVFDALTGTPKRLYKNVLGANITWMQMDGGGRKMLLGTATGRSTVLNAYTGCMINDMPMHAHEVTVVISDHEDNVVITMSRDGCIRMNDELYEGDDDSDASDADDDVAAGAAAAQSTYEARVARLLALEEAANPVKESERGVTEVNLESEGGSRAMILREITQAHDGAQLLAGAFSYEQSLVASGCALGRVRLWDFTSCGFLGEGVGHGSSIVALQFLTPFQALASADSSGLICIWDCRRKHKQEPRLRCLASIGLAELQARRQRELTAARSNAASAAGRDRSASSLSMSAPSGDAHDINEAADGLACMTAVAVHGQDAAPVLCVGTDAGELFVVSVQALLDTIASRLPGGEIIPEQESYMPGRRTLQRSTGGRPAPNIVRLRKEANEASQDARAALTSASSGTRQHAAVPTSNRAGKSAAKAQEAVSIPEDAKQFVDMFETLAAWRVVDGAALRCIRGSCDSDLPTLFCVDAIGGLSVFSLDVSTGGSLGELLCYLHTSVATAKAPPEDEWHFPLDPAQHAQRQMEEAAQLFAEVEALETETASKSGSDSDDDAADAGAAGEDAGSRPGSSLEVQSHGSKWEDIEFVASRPGTSSTTATALLGMSTLRKMKAAQESLSAAAQESQAKGNTMKVDTSEEEAAMEKLYQRAQAVKAAGQVLSTANTRTMDAAGAKAAAGHTKDSQGQGASGVERHIAAAERKRVFAQYLLEAVTWQVSEANLLKAQIRENQEAQMRHITEDAFGKSAQQTVEEQSRLQLSAQLEDGDGDSSDGESVASGVTHANLLELQAIDAAEKEEQAAAATANAAMGRRGLSEGKAGDILGFIQQRQAADGEQGEAKLEHDSLIGTRLGKVNTTRQAMAQCTSAAARARGIIEMSENLDDFPPEVLKLYYPELVQAARHMKHAHEVETPTFNAADQMIYDRIIGKTDSAMQQDVKMRKLGSSTAERAKAALHRRAAPNYTKQMLRKPVKSPSRVPSPMRSPVLRRSGLAAVAASPLSTPARRNASKADMVSGMDGIIAAARAARNSPPGAMQQAQLPSAPPSARLASPSGLLQADHRRASRPDSQSSSMRSSLTSHDGLAISSPIQVPSSAEAGGAGSSRGAAATPWDLTRGTAISAAAIESAQTPEARSRLIRAAYNDSFIPDDTVVKDKLKRLKQLGTSRFDFNKQGGRSAADVYRSVHTAKLFEFAEKEVHDDASQRQRAGRRVRKQLAQAAGVYRSAEEQLEDDASPSNAHTPADAEEALKLLGRDTVMDAVASARKLFKSSAQRIAARAKAVKVMQEQMLREHEGSAAGKLGEDRLSGKRLAKKARFGSYLKKDVMFFKRLFKHMDADGDGQLTLHELLTSEMLAEQPRMRRHFTSMFDAVDTDGSGTLSLEEVVPILFPAADRDTQEEICAFVRYEEPPPAPPTKKKLNFPPAVVSKLRVLFKLLDADGNGSISLQEIEDGVQEARLAYASKAANADVGVSAGHQLAPLLDDAQREIAQEIARQQEVERAKAEAAAEAAALEAERAAAERAAQRAAAQAAAARAPQKKSPGKGAAVRGFGGSQAQAPEPEKRMRKRVPPSAAIVGDTEESMRARAEVEARKSQKAKNAKKGGSTANLMPMFSQALAEQEAMFAQPNRARAKLKVDDRKATPKGAADKNINIDESPAALQHAEGELSFAQFVQLLGPTFVINKKLTPSQRRAQQLLEQLQRR